MVRQVVVQFDEAFVTVLAYTVRQFWAAVLLHN